MLNYLNFWDRLYSRAALLGFILGCVNPITVLADDRWSLQDSIGRVVEIAPEMKRADAQVGIQLGLVEQLTAWPNPSVSIQLDDSLGLDDADGGFDITRFAISQPLPWARIEPQRRQAEASLSSARAQRYSQHLSLEYKVAQYFHIVQLTEAELQLAKKRLQQASRYQHSSGKGNDPLIRYLTPLEVMRLDIILQAAQQSVEVAEGEYNEVAASFKALLGLAMDKPLRLMPLTLVSTPAAISVLEKKLQGHPVLKASQQVLTASRAGVAVRRAQRFADPVLTLFRETGFYANRRQTSNGIVLSMQVPLLNQNNGRVTQARYAVHQAQAELNLKQRELRTDLNKSHKHLGHLIEQAEHFRSRLLQPAQQVFALTRKGFKAGELNILTLIDANDTYFDAQRRHLELLQQGWMEMAEVRRAAGIFLTDILSLANTGSNLEIGAGNGADYALGTQSSGVN